MAFSLNTYPVVYRAKYTASSWSEEWLEKPHRSPDEEARMDDASRDALAESRNNYDDMPLVNYTSQYGLGCFEGLKALPQKDGGLAIFRPDRNAARFKKSMEGLLMPGVPEDLFVAACVEAVRRNAKLGFRPAYDAKWEKDSFMTADSVYIGPSLRRRRHRRSAFPQSVVQGEHHTVRATFPPGPPRRSRRNASAPRRTAPA
jgi:branched-chain amino acid aminotransferase